MTILHNTVLPIEKIQEQNTDTKEARCPTWINSTRPNKRRYSPSVARARWWTL